jgi:hypothetical protein
MRIEPPRDDRSSTSLRRKLTFRWVLPLALAAAPLLSLCPADALEVDQALLAYFPDTGCGEALCDYAKTYEQSRDRFDAEARKHGVEPERFPIDSQTDPGLSIDTAFFRSPNPKTLLVVQSGIHGSEAVAGAAVQLLLMDRWLDKFLANGTDVYLIHAVNPWGYKHDRRTEEHNINLNRNFPIKKNGGYQSVYDDDVARSSGYEKYKSTFEPKGTIGSVLSREAKLGFQFFWSWLTDGFTTKYALQAFGAGQYSSPDGLNFGGAKNWKPDPTPQTNFYLEHAAKHIAAPEYQKVLILDFHTGLGDSGVLAVIKGMTPPEDLMAKLEASLKIPHEDECKTPDQNKPVQLMLTTSNCPGFFPTYGDVIDFMPTLGGEGKVLAVTMEYGTLGRDPSAQINSAAMMILENQKYANQKNGTKPCSDEQVCKIIDRKFSDLFNPPDKIWRTQVLQEADFVFGQLLSY